MRSRQFAVCLGFVLLGVAVSWTPSGSAAISKELVTPGEEQALVAEPQQKNAGEAVDLGRKKIEGALDHADRKTYTNGLGMKFVWIPPGEFMMGSPADERRRGKDELQHKVKLTKGFYMGAHVVTQQEWLAVMGRELGRVKPISEKKVPVVEVTWDDCQRFIGKLREKDNKPYRLPTEAEWEYACRAGTTTPFSVGAKITTDDANFEANSPETTGEKKRVYYKASPVDAFPPNPWGLYDMHGNVVQWCQDWYGEYSPDAVVDPTGPDSGFQRVLRGGAADRIAREVRSAARHKQNPRFATPFMGMRLAFSEGEAKKDSAPNAK